MCHARRPVEQSRRTVAPPRCHMLPCVDASPRRCEENAPGVPPLRTGVQISRMGLYPPGLGSLARQDEKTNNLKSENANKTWDPIKCLPSFELIMNHEQMLRFFSSGARTEGALSTFSLFSPSSPETQEALQSCQHNNACTPPRRPPISCASFRHTFRTSPRYQAACPCERCLPSRATGS